MLTFRQFITESNISFKTGVPVTFEYFKHNNKTENYGTRFGQHIEPAGRYVTAIESNREHYADVCKTYPGNYEMGSITFENPFVIDFGGGYTEESNWKFVLSNKFKGKKGKSLSKAIVKAGYDGIVTMEKTHSAEIVDLRMFK